MNHDSYSEAYIRDILTSCKVFAMVGASANPVRPSYFVQKYLLAKGYDVIPVNPGLAGNTLLGQTVYASLRDMPRPIEIVDIFRNSAAALDITKEAIAIGAKVVWMQLGVRNDEAAAIAEAAGLKVVMNRCPKIEYGGCRGKSAGPAYTRERCRASARCSGRAVIRSCPYARDSKVKNRH